MKLTNIVLFFLFISVTTYSQETFNSNDLRVTNDDLTATSFPKNTLASALVIYEIGNTFVNRDNFRITSEIKRKIKIFNSDGFYNGNISIHLRKSGKKKEKISNIIAWSHNYVNNDVVKTKLNSSDIYIEESTKNYDLVKFAIPNIKEGTVITYSYTLETPFDYNYVPWYFQSEIPKLKSEYKTSIPGNWEYNIKLVGGLKLSYRNETIEYHCIEVGNSASAHCSNVHYIMEDIPAFRPEKHTTSLYNYLSRIEYELAVFKNFSGQSTIYTKTWEQVDKDLKANDNLGKLFYKKGPIKEIISKIKKGNTTLETAQNIYNYVQENYSWNESYSMYSGNSIKNLIEEKSGTISEINILLLNLLDAFDIETYPTFASTRENGFITKVYPVISDFNYLLVKTVIDGDTYYLDATHKCNPFGEVPFKLLNHYFRVLDVKYGSYWEDYTPKKPSTQQNKIELTIAENNVFKGSMNIISTGYNATDTKTNYFKNPSGYVKNIQSVYDNITLNNHKLVNGEKNSFSIEEEFDISYPIEDINGKLYINPFINPRFNENPFKLQQRTYPIDFGYKDVYLYRIKLNFDDTYEILELPEQKMLSLPNNTGKLIFSTKKQDNTVELYFKVNFNETLYAAEYYTYLKEFLSTLVDIQMNTLIVVQKN
ncbi:hypothetical protein RM697_02760 [Ichthyenterobacterium sp. W332]|uniref:DUF3857 domain-containing protein n=1 Tax=Microcosmobacter mediterraneus TaxID=3075607 RepID=A0ABU2YHD5_9FLAO|nr:hypothetical protein [Ichthyenterobacterium sp. W332]MDT0557553.1 hypothetical protein [Ichthyenterobacterium sp. W332]